jgi:hypothetical protein
VYLRAVTVENGNPLGILVTSGGTLNLDASMVTGTSGAGIHVNAGSSLAVSNSTISNNNSTSWNGGGIDSNGPVSVTASTISGNGGRYGGGIYSNSTLQLLNTTVTHNAASQQGGGIYLDYGGFATIDSSTLAYNGALAGSGIWSNPYASQLRNTLLDDNTCAGTTIIDDGYNLEYQEGNSLTCGFTDHAVSGNPALALPLTDNGGPTQTLALYAESAAINAGSCTTIAGATNSVDQRGQPRPGVAGSSCDIGAFEVQGAPTSPTSTTYYVNGSSGSDSNDCLSTATACATIGGAL